MPDTPAAILDSMNSFDSIFALELDTKQRFENALTGVQKPIEYPIPNFEKDFYPNGLPQNDLLDPSKMKGTLGEALFSPDLRIANYAAGKIRDNQSRLPVNQGVGVPDRFPYDKIMEKYLNGDFGYNPYQSIEENEDFNYRYDYLNQSVFERVAKNSAVGVSRFLSSVVLKLGQTLGHLGSMIGNGIEEIINAKENNFMADVADNSFSRWFEGLEEDMKNSNLLSVFKPANWEDRGFFNKLGNGAFWTDEVADGAAFMGEMVASMYLLGGMGRVGGLGRLGATPINTAARLGTTGKVLDRIIKFSTGAEDLSGVGRWAFATTSESAFEASSLYTRRKDELTKDRQAGKNSLTDDEIERVAGDSAAASFKANMLILGASSAFENRFIFSPLFRKLGKTAPNPRGSAIAISEATDSLDNLAAASKRTYNYSTWLGKKLNWKDPSSRLKFYGGRGLSAIGVEGYWEENAQLAVERLASTDNLSMDTFLHKLMGQTLAALPFTGIEDPEAQTNIGLGGLIGLGGTAIVSKVTGGSKLFRGERRQREVDTGESIRTYEKYRRNFLSFQDLYIRDENKKPVLDEYGNLQIDEDKAVGILDGLNMLTSKQAAIDKVSDPLLKKHMQDDALSDFVVAAKSAGVFERALNRFENLDSLDSIQLQNLGFDPATTVDVPYMTESIREIGKIYDNVYSSPPARMKSGDTQQDEDNRKFNLFKSEVRKYSAEKLAAEYQSRMMERDFPSVFSPEAESNSSPVQLYNSLIYQQDGISKFEEFTKDLNNDFFKRYIESQKLHIENERNRIRQTIQDRLDSKELKEDSNGLIYSTTKYRGYKPTEVAVLEDMENQSQIKHAELTNTAAQYKYLMNMLGNIRDGIKNYKAYKAFSDAIQARDAQTRQQAQPQPATPAPATSTPSQPAPTEPAAKPTPAPTKKEVVDAQVVMSELTSMLNDARSIFIGNDPNIEVDYISILDLIDLHKQKFKKQIVDVIIGFIKATPDNLQEQTIKFLDELSKSLDNDMLEPIVDFLELTTTSPTPTPVAEVTQEPAIVEDQEAKKKAELEPLLKERDELIEEIARIEKELSSSVPPPQPVTVAPSTDVVIVNETRSVIENNVTPEEVQGLMEELDIPTEKEVLDEVETALTQDVRDNGSTINTAPKTLLEKIVQKIKKLLLTLFYSGVIWTSMSAASGVSIKGTTVSYDKEKALETALVIVPDRMTQEAASLLPQVEKEQALRFLEKIGKYESEDAVVEVYENESQIEESNVDISANRIKPSFEVLGSVPDSYNPIDSLLIYRSTWNNEDGFEYIAGPNKAERQGKNIKIQNVVGVGHFLLDGSVYTAKPYMHDNNWSFLNEARTKNHYVPAFKRLPNGKVLVKYKRFNELDTTDIVVSPLRQYSVASIDWGNQGTARGFKSSIKELKTNEGQGTYLIFKDRKGYSRFSGGSVVFIFEKNGNRIVIDFAGSIDMIQRESERIAQDYQIDPKDLVLGYHDVGSFSAKPKSKQGEIETRQYEGYNPSGVTGGAILIPIPDTSKDKSPAAIPALMLSALALVRRKRENNEPITNDDLDTLKKRLAEVEDLIKQIEEKYAPKETGDLLTSIREKASEFEKAETLQYFVDQAGANPYLFYSKYGDNITNQLLDMVTPEALIDNYKNAARFDLTSDNSLTLEQILNKRGLNVDDILDSLDKGVEVEGHSAALAVAVQEQASKVADIERRRQEELDSLNNAENQGFGNIEDTRKRLNDKYDAELAALTAPVPVKTPPAEQPPAAKEALSVGDSVIVGTQKDGTSKIKEIRGDKALLEDGRQVLLSKLEKTTVENVVTNVSPTETQERSEATQADLSRSDNSENTPPPPPAVPPTPPRAPENSDFESTQSNNDLDVLVDSSKINGLFTFVQNFPAEMVSDSSGNPVVKDGAIQMKTTQGDQKEQLLRLHNTIRKMSSTIEAVNFWSEDTEGNRMFRVKLIKGDPNIHEKWVYQTAKGLKDSKGVPYKFPQIIAVITDIKGNPVYFDLQGNIVDKVGGQPVAFPYSVTEYTQANLFTSRRGIMTGSREPLNGAPNYQNFSPLSDIYAAVEQKVDIYGTIDSVTSGKLSSYNAMNSPVVEMRDEYKLRTVKEMVESGDISDDSPVVLKQGTYWEYATELGGTQQQKIKIGQPYLFDRRSGLNIPLRGKKLRDITFNGNPVFKGKLQEYIEGLQKDRSIEISEESSPEAIELFSSLYNFLKMMFYSKDIFISTNSIGNKIYLTDNRPNDSTSVLDLEINYNDVNLETSIIQMPLSEDQISYKSFIQENFVSGAIPIEIEEGNRTIDKVNRRIVFTLDKNHEQIVDSVSVSRPPKKTIRVSSTDMNKFVGKTYRRKGGTAMVTVTEFKDGKFTVKGARGEVQQSQEEFMKSLNNMEEIVLPVPSDEVKQDFENKIKLSEEEERELNQKAKGMTKDDLDKLDFNC